jgi:hypothetical protein
MDFYNYFSEICAKSRLAQENGFLFAKVSGISGLEECVANAQMSNAFFAVDDVTDGSVIMKNGHFFTRRILTVILLQRFTLQEQATFNHAMDTCRELRRQIFSRLLHDRVLPQYRDLTYIDLSQSLFRELERATLAGCTGTYIMFNVDIPTNYTYNADDWSE